MMTSPATEPATVRSPRPRWLVLLVLALGIGIGAVVAGVIATRDDDQPDVSSAAQLTRVQSSCRDWMSSSQGGRADDQWCTDMFAWMGDQSGGSMMGSMMWRGPEQMTTSCRQWVDQDRRSTASADQRCTEMVDWMDQHMPSRGGHWMVMQG